MSEETKKIELGGEGLYDARKLGVPKMLVLGVQHTFATFPRRCCSRASERCCSIC